MPAAVDTGGLPVSLLVVTSPAPSNPSTVLLQASLDSTLACLPEMSPATTPLLIVMDGYTIAGRGRWPNAALPPRRHSSMLHGSPHQLYSLVSMLTATAQPHRVAERTLSSGQISPRNCQVEQGFCG